MACRRPRSGAAGDAPEYPGRRDIGLVWRLRTTGRGPPARPVSWDGFQYFATDDGIMLEDEIWMPQHGDLAMNNHYAGMA